jgi:23S rRNA (guanosine2251-2'-O)-methyltransferase
VRFVYGTNPVLEAVRAHPQEILRILVERGHDGRPSHGAERVVRAAQEASVRVEDVPRGELQRRSSGGAHQGVGAELSEFRYAELDDLLAPGEGKVFLVVLDGVTDPQNLGAVMRSAETAGATGLVLGTHRAVGLTPAVAKAAAGALEYLPVAFVSGIPGALDRARRAGVWCAGLDADGDQSLFELTVADAPLVLVLGAEGRGLSRLARARCDVVASIPMHGHIASLNVSAAAAVACTEIARRRAG